MRLCVLLPLATLLVDSVLASGWTPRGRAPQRRAQPSPASQGFVTATGTQFQRNGQPFFYFATTAYWLMQLSDDNIDATLASIAAKNITVVRTWAFNDVFEIPQTGAWFQLFNPNGTVTINTGPSGLQRLDTIFRLAEKHNLFIQPVLTNNWNPFVSIGNDTKLVTRAVTNNVTHAPGFLSNNYGGIDAYIQAHGLDTHDQFFSNDTVISAFENVMKVVLPRYSNQTRLVAWELANDPRCNSSIPASNSCQPQVLTKWHARVSQTARQLDPNHLVASGAQGFYCVGCPKLFPLNPPAAPPAPPPPQTSPAPGQRKRSLGLLTVDKLLSQRREAARRFESRTKKVHRSGKAEGTAKWTYRGPLGAAEKLRQRQTPNIQAVGPAFDGAQGVDSEDILNIPTIGFNTFQLFPDQNTYGPPVPGADASANAIETGTQWIENQATTAQTFDKPTALTGFGIVTVGNLPVYVPFNSSQAVEVVNSTNPVASQAVTSAGIVNQANIANDTEQEEVYAQWIAAALRSGVAGITQYQWGQANLTVPQQSVSTNPSPSPSPSPSPNVNNAFVPALPEQQQVTSTGTQPEQQQVTTAPSPNDGYQAITDSLHSLFQRGALAQIAKNLPAVGR